MVLHLPGAGLFDDQQTFGGVCCKGHLAPSDIGENIKHVKPNNATFFDASNNPYPSGTAENHNEYLVLPNKIIFNHLDFIKPAGTNLVVGSDIELNRDNMLPTP